MLRHSLLFFFFVDLVTFCIAKRMFLPSLTSEMSLNNFFFLLKMLEKSILMGVCDVSLSISSKNPWKMFSNNS